VRRGGDKMGCYIGILNVAYRIFFHNAGRDGRLVDGPTTEIKQRLARVV
jgi:hypothetical protein